MINLLDYFDFEIKWNGDIPNFKLKLKEELKITEKPLFRSDGRPISGANEQYYIHYLGEIGHEVYNTRRLLFHKPSLIKWYIDTFKPDNEIIDRLNDYVILFSKKLSESQRTHYQSEAGIIRKKNNSERMLIYSKTLAKINSDLWKDPEFYDKIMKLRHDSGMYESNSIKIRNRYNDPVFMERFLAIMRNPKRKEKISQHSKKMWEEFKDGKSDRFKNSLKTGSVKKFILNNINMNSVEYLVGTILNDMNLKWEYSKAFKFDKKWYLPDFYVSEHNLIIECYGDYWHANPQMFKETDMIHSKKTAKEFWEYDEIKKDNYVSNSYKFLILWENEINSNLTECKQKIQNIINE